jgi:hypothetical protein
MPTIFARIGKQLSGCYADTYDDRENAPYKHEQEAQDYRLDYAVGMRPNIKGYGNREQKH